MIDIHTHIIPEIDDGAKNIEMTLEMLKEAEESGINEIIATPHYLLEYGEAKINEVKEHVSEISKIAEEHNIKVKVYSGQEVYFTENIVNDFLDGNIGTLNDSRYMLIEFDMRKFEESAFDYLYELKVRGIVPIIAHIERYRFINKNPEMINRFINEGYLFQLNSGSIEGKFGDDAKKTAQLFLKNNIYSFIGSDAHNTSRRNIDMTEALKSIDEEKVNDFWENSRKLIKNEEIEFTGSIIKKRRGFFDIFKRR